MQINSSNSLGLMTQNSSAKFIPGQRLFIEIISKKPSGEGIILLEGQEIPALLETTAGAGEKIWVRIREMTENGLLLVNEPQQNLPESSPVREKPQTILQERGLPETAGISKILDSFNNIEKDFSLLLQILSGEDLSDLPVKQRETINQLLQKIPQWSDFSGEKGVEQILQLLKGLGIDYEARLNKVLQAKGEKQSNELQELLSTLKPLVIKILQDPESLISVSHHKNLHEILEQLTGQQLWLRTGDRENAYILLHIPLHNDERMFLAKFAIESTRKSNKMDIEHCHLALELETEVLGKVGVDLWFFEENLTLRVLTSQPENLAPLLEQILPLTKEKFQQIGFNLRSVATGNLSTDQEFRQFISGRRKKGVDLII